ncbi:hypothetical protein BJ170DRAFT_681358 [Xylariales sp. AK1849]|nr:hypothetical protein BJ170DRAFT_681358 [Xylariales sp. AK1849]
MEAQRDLEFRPAFEELETMAIEHLGYPEFEQKVRSHLTTELHTSEGLPHGSQRTRKHVQWSLVHRLYSSIAGVASPWTHLIPGSVVNDQADDPITNFEIEQAIDAPLLIDAVGIIAGRDELLFDPMAAMNVSLDLVQQDPAEVAAAMDEEGNGNDTTPFHPEFTMTGYTELADSMTSTQPDNDSITASYATDAIRSGHNASMVGPDQSGPGRIHNHMLLDAHSRNIASSTRKRSRASASKRAESCMFIPRHITHRKRPAAFIPRTPNPVSDFIKPIHFTEPKARIPNTRVSNPSRHTNTWRRTNSTMARW